MFDGTKFIIIRYVSMHSAWLRSNFHRVLKFLQIKEVGRNFWKEPILQKVWIICSPLSVFQFWKFYEPKFIVIYQISMHSAWFRSTFVRVLKFQEIKEKEPNFLGEPVLQKVWMIWSPLLYFNFKSFVDQISLLFIRY